MSAFSSIAQQWTVNVSDITDALKSGTVSTKEAATLLERVKLVNKTASDLAVEPNSYEGMRTQLAPEHLDKYDAVMTIRGGIS